MILIIHNNEITEKELHEKNVSKITSVGELNLFKGTSVSLKDEFIKFQSNSKVKLKVGLKWIKENYVLDSIIFVCHVKPIKESVLDNHLFIPINAMSIDDHPLEWSNYPLLNKVKVNNEVNKKIRKVAHFINLDFIYGNALSLDSNIINKNIIKELNNLNQFDAFNELIYTCNKFASDNQLDIYNICIGKSDNSNKILDLSKFFEKLL